MTMQYFTPTVFEETPSAVTATPSVEIGAKRYWKGEEYVYGYNAGGNTAVVGYGVKLVTACSGYSVAMTSISDVVNPCVGCIKNSDIPAASYGWVLTKGFLTLHTANSVMTGDYVSIGLGASGGFGTTAYGTGVIGTNNAMGYALNVNTASGGAFYAFIRTSF